MNKTLLTDTIRTIKKSFTRFLSILLIIAIGVGFFAGIKASGVDMKLTTDDYYDTKQLMDIRLVSTLGFDKNDLATIKERHPNVEVRPSYSFDLYANKGDVQDTVKVHSLSDSPTINRVELAEGRMPEKSGECLVEPAFIREGLYSLGDTIKLSKEEGDLLDSLKKDQYTIVGAIHSPQYISYERGNSTIGSGSTDYFVMIPENDVSLDVYTEVYLYSPLAEKEASYTPQYDDLIDSLVHELETTADLREEERYSEIFSQAQSKIDEAKDELEKGRAELEDAVTKAKAEFQKGQEQIDQGLEDLKKQESTFWSKINNQQEEIDSGFAKLAQGQKDYEEGLAGYKGNKKTLEEEIQSLNENKEFLPIEEYDQALEQATAALATLETKGQELESTGHHLTSTQSQLEKGQSQLNTQKKKGIVGIKSGKDELDRAQRDLDAEKEKFDLEIKKANKEIEDGQKKIEDAEKDLSEIEKPTWHIFTRDDNPGYSEYGQNADRIDAIAKVFPVFFLIVALLVSLTTLTRMVEEERTQIGTLKALGYGKASIASKYFIYANLAGLLGSLLGLAVGFRLFPWVIFNAYGIMYDLPPVITPYHTDFAAYSIIAGLTCTSLSVLLACYKELLAPPSELMRPKSPKPGKRVTLERIPLVWNKLSFTAKVTVRNLFRYKKRMFMTVFGIAGSAALILIGFGVKDSIADISNMQFGELTHYDMMAMLKEDINTKGLEDMLEAEDGVESFSLAYVNSAKAQDSTTSYTVNLFVPSDEKVLGDYVNLRTYEAHDPVELSHEGVVITKKLSTLLDIEIGEEIQIVDSENMIKKLRVSNIVENYISHYIYMTDDYYQQVFEEAPTSNVIMGNLSNPYEDYGDELSKGLLERDEIIGVNFTRANIEVFDDMIVSLNYVVLVLILSASLLAFVVLYNLTNINVNERIREIATIKVLGFYDNEVSAYIYRENIALTIIGILFGSGLGKLLHQFVMQTAETNDLMFGRSIMPKSYVFAALITILFALSINIVTHFKLKKVSMVESLKSVE